MKGKVPTFRRRDFLLDCSAASPKKEVLFPKYGFSILSSLSGVCSAAREILPFDDQIPSCLRLWEGANQFLETREEKHLTPARVRQTTTPRRVTLGSQARPKPAAGLQTITGLHNLLIIGLFIGCLFYAVHRNCLDSERLTGAGRTCILCVCDEHARGVHTKYDPSSSGHGLDAMPFEG